MYYSITANRSFNRAYATCKIERQHYKFDFRGYPYLCNVSNTNGFRNYFSKSFNVKSMGTAIQCITNINMTLK